VIVIGSPVYFGYPTGQVRSLVERLLFPLDTYLVDEQGNRLKVPHKPVQTALIYTMNCPENLSHKVGYDTLLGFTGKEMGRLYGYNEILCSYETLQLKDEMLESFLDGVKEGTPDIEVEKVNLYDLGFKGCRSCFACQLKSAENGQCLFHDGAYDLLRGIKSSDGFVFAAPVYYFDVPSQMRAILERLFYPGGPEREIPVATIYTMNQKQENMEKYFKRHLDDIAFFFRNQFKTEPEQLYIYNTLHWENPEKYNFSMDRYTDKVKNRELNNSADQQACHDAGARFAEKVSHKAL
jgi:multimeric flavodoxin WrbA